MLELSAIRNQHAKLSNHRARYGTWFWSGSAATFNATSTASGGKFIMILFSSSNTHADSNPARLFPSLNGCNRITSCIIHPAFLNTVSNVSTPNVILNGAVAAMLNRFFLRPPGTPIGDSDEMTECILAKSVRLSEIVSLPVCQRPVCLTSICVALFP